MYNISPRTRIRTPVTKNASKFEPPGINGRGSVRMYIESGTAGSSRTKTKHYKFNIVNFRVEINYLIMLLKEMTLMQTRPSTG